MATWRALMSPSRNVSLQDQETSTNQERSYKLLNHKKDPHISTQPKLGRHTKTQSINQSQPRPTIKRKISNSFEGDKAFIQSSNILDDLKISEESSLRKQLRASNRKIRQMFEDIDKQQIGQQQVESLQRQILLQRMKYKTRINQQLGECSTKIARINQLLLSKPKNK